MLSFLFDYAEPSVLVLCGLSIVLACLLIWGIKRVRVENDRMNEIASYIKNGAMAYLYRQYRTLALFLVVMFCALAFLPGLGFDLAGAFLFGAALSVLAGYLGMRTAVISNVRTAAEARNGISAAFRVAFSGGAVMGIFVVGLGAFGIALLSLITDNTNVLTGFSLGASSIALFCRVGGGIYTKAADVGADLVGKVEAGIPEDDPKNPAVIADNVGDNVGDVAGMGADLFESYVGCIVAAMLLVGVTPDMGVSRAHILLLVAGGLFASLVGIVLVRLLKVKNAALGLNIGTYTSSALLVVFALLLFFKDIKIFFAVAGKRVGSTYVKTSESVAAHIRRGCTTCIRTCS